MAAVPRTLSYATSEVVTITFIPQRPAPKVREMESLSDVTRPYSCRITGYVSHECLWINGYTMALRPLRPKFESWQAHELGLLQIFFPQPSATSPDIAPILDHIHTSKSADQAPRFVTSLLDTYSATIRKG